MRLQSGMRFRGAVLNRRLMAGPAQMGRTSGS